MSEGEIRWSLVGAKEPIELPLGVRLVAGRAPDAPIQLPKSDAAASRYHAALEASGLGVQVVDLDSRNGVFVNGYRQATALVRERDTLVLGGTTFRVARRVEPIASRREVKQRPAIPAFALGTVKAIPYVCEVCGRDGPVPSIDHEAWWIDVAWICPPCARARQTAPSTWEVEAPSRIGDFELLRYLATGGMSAVYEARHVHGGMRAAVKIVLPERGLDPLAIRRFMKEQKIASGLAHARIARTIAVGTGLEGHLYVATEFLSRGDSEPLAGPTSDVRVVLGLAADMFEALGYAHENGFVHRDVKPGNLLLAGNGRGKLADFGLAKSFRDFGGTVLTKEGDIGGSAAFVAPEQLLGFRDVGPSADVYSAGTTLYFLLTGALPIVLPCAPRDATDPQMCLAALDEARVSIASRRALNPWLVQWIDLLVTRDHGRRAHLVATQVAAALRSAASS